MAKPPRDRRTQPARQPTYKRLSARVDRLEDAISHFYNVINELRPIFLSSGYRVFLGRPRGVRPLDIR